MEECGSGVPLPGVVGGWSQGPSCCPWQGAPGGWWPIMGAGKLPVTQGKEEQTSGPEGLCVGGDLGAMAQGRGEGLSLAWRSEVGVLARDWAGLPSALLWQGFSELCQCLRGPAARCRLCAGAGERGVRTREREGLCSHASAWLWLQTLGAGPVSPVGMSGARCGPGRGLCVPSQSLGAEWLV